MASKSPVRRVLIAGPKPPPWGGAAVSFDIFCRYCQENSLANFRCSFFDLRWRSSSQEPLAAFWAIFRNLLLFSRCFFTALVNDHLVLFGSQRFVTWFAAPLTLLLYPFGVTVSIRVFGGGYDGYLAAFPSFLSSMVCFCLGLTKSIVFQTKELQTTLQEKIATEIRVVPNYRERGDSVTSPREGSVCFTYAGFVRPQKGINELITAFNELREEGMDIKLNLLGPLFLDELSDVTLSAEGIELHGELSQEEVLKQLQESDVFVYPTYWEREGIPGVLLEAGLAALPIITTRWKAIPSLIVDGKNGLLVEPRSVDSLKDAMKRLVDDEELAKELAKDCLVTMGEYEAQKVCPELASALFLSS